jgi:cation transport ATPase
VLVDVRPAPGIDPDRLLAWAASAEQYSAHVLADGIRRAASARGIAVEAADDAHEEATNGVTAVIGGRRVVVGKPAYVAALAPDTTLTALEAGMRPRTSLSTGASREPSCSPTAHGRVAGRRALVARTRRGTRHDAHR